MTFHKDSIMKKRYCAFLLLIGVLPALAACGKKTDYSGYISEARYDIFRAETEEFAVTLSCISREYPYASDGIPCPMTNVVEISLIPSAAEIADYSVYVAGDTEWGGEASFRNAYGDWFYSQSVSAFPKGSVTLRIEWDDEVRELVATSVKNEKTLSLNEALNAAVKAEKERIDRMTADGAFHGEFYVRLVRRDTNYYYVGIVGTDGEITSLLLDGETGEVLAKREGTR